MAVVFVGATDAAVRDLDADFCGLEVAVTGLFDDGARVGTLEDLEVDGHDCGGIDAIE